MNRNTLLGAACVALALIAGCDKSPAEAENDARDAQRRAAEEIASAKAKADEAAASAKAKATDAAKDAEDALVKARADLRAKTNKDLNDISAQMDDLRLKASKSTGKAKVDMDAKLARLDKQMASVKSDLDALDRTTATNLDAAKARIESGVSDLKKSMSETSLKM